MRRKIFLILSLSLSSCGIYKRSDIKDNPGNVEERVRKNIEEGRGVRFGIGGAKGGTFDFASSNEMWRASIEILDFISLTNASYSGGIIITDWYSTNENLNQSIKISVQFLTEELRADGLLIKVYQKNCSINSNCTVKLIESDLNQEIKLAILKKAAEEL